VNTIQTESGTEVYASRIHEVTDLYISELPNGESDLYDQHAFQGLMRRLNKDIFRAKESRMYDLRTVIDTSNVDEIAEVWDIYTALCNRYRHRITLQRFSIMVGISMVTFHNWETEKYRGQDALHVNTIKRMLTECESSLQDGAYESNAIGCIFGLKAAHGWVEKSPTISQEYIPTNQQQTPEMIMEKYRDVPKPTLIDMEDD